MAHQHLAQVPADHLPEPDRRIMAPAGQGFAVGGKGQSDDPVGMPDERLDAGRWLRLLDLPQSNLPREAAASEQASIRTPGGRIHRISMWQRLEVRACLGIPESHGPIISSAG